MAIQARTVATATKPLTASVATPAKVAATTVVKANGAVHHEQTTIFVSKTVLQNGKAVGEPVERTEFEIHPFHTSTATVALSAQLTKNLGNYEGVKVFVSVSMPCYVEEMDDAKAQVSDKVQQYLGEEMGTLGDFLGGMAGEVEQIEGTAEVTAEGTAEESNVTPDWVLAAERSELEALIRENPQLGVDPTDYPDDDDFKAAINTALFPPEGGAEAETTTTDEVVEEVTEEGEGYSREQLEDKGVTLDDLKGVYAKWDMGDFPKGPPPIVRKKAIDAIMAAQGLE